MLVLTRRAGEVIKIGDEVTVTILETFGNKVRIGIDAPKGIPVHREEIYRKIAAEREAAQLVSGAVARRPASDIGPTIASPYDQLGARVARRSLSKDQPTLRLRQACEAEVAK